MYRISAGAGHKNVGGPHFNINFFSLTLFLWLFLPCYAHLLILLYYLFPCSFYPSSSLSPSPSPYSFPEYAHARSQSSATTLTSRVLSYLLCLFIYSNSLILLQAVTACTHAPLLTAVYFPPCTFSRFPPLHLAYVKTHMFLLLARSLAHSLIYSLCPPTLRLHHTLH